MKRKYQEFFKNHWPLLISIPILLALISFTLGRYPIGLKDLLKTICFGKRLAK